MSRLLLFLPLCLAVQAAPPPSTALPLSAVALVAVADDGGALPDALRMEQLAKTNPIGFMEACLRRYEREVKGYTAVLVKQERLGGKLYPQEVIDVKFRQHPFSVLLDWRQGTRLARKVLYVKGENNNKLLVKPAGLAGLLVRIVERDPEGPEAKESGRYPLTEFGIAFGEKRTIAAWKNAIRHNNLDISFLGIKPIKELNNRPCYILQRNNYKVPEEDGISQYTTYIDKETWLQTGNILLDANGQLIASYFFRDVKINPTFAPGTFTPAALQ